MAMYQLQKATLGDVSGKGYAFAHKTFFGKAYQGVFFPDEDEAVETLRDQGELVFSGSVYHRRRDRTSRRSTEELTVAIVDSTVTPMGHRAEFEAKEEF
jgi:hypothetical protein